MIVRNTLALFAFRFNGFHLGRFAVAAVFLSFSSSWSACYPISNWGSGQVVGNCSGYIGGSCNNFTCSQWNTPPSECASSVRGQWGGGWYIFTAPQRCPSSFNLYCTYNLRCDDDGVSADSANCVLEGNVWQNGQCQGPLDSTACDSYRQECEAYGGKFTGHLSAESETGCISFCDICSSQGQELFRRSRALICCRKGMVPPVSVTSCENLQLTGSADMSISSFDCDNRGGYDCECEDIDSENASTYNSICNNNEWPEPEPSSSSGGGEPESSSGGSPSDSSGDWEYDYRDSLHRIIKYDSINMENTSAILSCLLSPVSCDGLQRDTTIVNVPSDSVILKDIRQNQNSMNTMVDSSIHKSTERLGERIDTSIHASNNRLGTSIDLSLGRANDSLIDSIGKYVRSISGRNADSLHNVAEAVRNLNGTISNFDSATREAMREIISSLSGSGVSAFDSALGSGPGADSNGVSFNWLSHGDALGDSILGGSGYGGLDFAGDSLLRDSLENAGYSCDNDSCCIGSRCIYFDSDSLINDSLTRFVSRMGDTIDARNKSYLEDSTSGLFQEVMDSLHAFNPLGVFDSTMLNTLGAKIPNSNTCPENCSKFQADVPIGFWHVNMNFDFGLCLGRPVFANGNILSFLRFIIRLIIAITCISAVMWNASRIRR